MVGFFVPGLASGQKFAGKDVTLFHGCERSLQSAQGTHLLGLSVFCTLSKASCGNQEWIYIKGCQYEWSLYSMHVSPVHLLIDIADCKLQHVYTYK